MSEFKGTPGPWQVLEYLGSVWTKDGNQMVASAIGDGRHRSEKDYQAKPTDKEAVLVNARLIAAAPDLLEALQGVLRTENDTHRESDDRWAVARYKAHAAIKKALGDE